MRMNMEPLERNRTGLTWIENTLSDYWLWTTACRRYSINPSTVNKETVFTLVRRDRRKAQPRVIDRLETLEAAKERAEVHAKYGE
jgi:hypothetical protein